MSSDATPAVSARALELEERGHALRRKMASRPDVLTSIEAGREAEKRGELIPIEQLDRELGLEPD